VLLFAPAGLFYQNGNPCPELLPVPLFALARRCGCHSRGQVLHRGMEALPRRLWRGGPPSHVMVLLLSRLRGVVGMGANAGSTTRTLLGASETRTPMRADG
jgi:hypothetical protein